MLNRYQTGALTTLVIFALLTAGFVLGLVRVFEFHKAMGWVQSLTCVLSLFTFHQRFKQDAN